MAAFVRTLFVVLTFTEVEVAYGSRTPNAGQLAVQNSRSLLHSTHKHKLNRTAVMAAARKRMQNATAMAAVRKRIQSETVQYFKSRVSNMSKMYPKLTAGAGNLLKKRKRTKFFRPINRSAELAANKEKPFYKKMTALKAAKGLVGPATWGLSFHLGRHSKNEECGAKWEEGCVEAAACYTSVEDWGCCWPWHSHMDTEGACGACAEAKGYCDACFPESMCAAKDGEAKPEEDGEKEHDDMEHDDMEWSDGGDDDWGDWGDDIDWKEEGWDEHPGEWQVQEMSDDEMRKVFEQEGVNPAAIENTCGDKWDFICAQSWACYDIVEENGCCNAADDPPSIFMENDCAACAQVIGICDDCFPMSPCGDDGLQNVKQVSSGGRTWSQTFDPVPIDVSGANGTAESTTTTTTTVNADKCLIANPSFKCIGYQCIPQADYALYSAYGGAWCLPEGHDLCKEADAGWCSGECNCPGSCQHACGRCPPATSLTQLSTSPARSAFIQYPNDKPMATVHHTKRRKSAEAHYSKHHKELQSDEEAVVHHTKRRHGEVTFHKTAKSSEAASPAHNEPIMGDKDCPCIGFSNVEGTRMVRLNNQTMAPYPADFGSSCQAWDDGRNYLGCMPGQKPGQGNDWCAQKWCYIDPCKCDIEALPRESGTHSLIPKTSPYLPGAEFQAHHIYYSYATCGGKDSFTASRMEACVNQQTEKDCAKLPKCAWHESKCMGKELATVCKKKLEVTKWGDNKCRCIGIDNLVGDLIVNAGDKSGTSFQQQPALGKLHFPTKVVKYPADAGATCEAWDDGRHPDCSNKDASKRPDWCKQKWCYVDPCSCDMDIPPKVSKYIPGATFQGIPVYYSYDACGSVDTWTAKHHEKACVNQKSEAACGKLDPCTWTDGKCLGKELVGHCPGMVEKEKAAVSKAAKTKEAKEKEEKSNAAGAGWGWGAMLLVLAQYWRCVA